MRIDAGLRPVFTITSLIWSPLLPSSGTRLASNNLASLFTCRFSSASTQPRFDVIKPRGEEYTSLEFLISQLRDTQQLWPEDTDL
ncbi:hypothetical protein C0Q70_14110 [Pomacea canaliculata]|uniref:Uncharacterized protein n=1 Tax=Pomacea canaliculata TaxID=400727 RepID=A0A2T7NZ73_POMCA|nr:hypothetical protein C0Q70_14110 [Pomacea canaliculata]